MSCDIDYMVSSANKCAFAFKAAADSIRRFYNAIPKSRRSASNKRKRDRQRAR
jgi:hypothetical protein